MCYTLQCQHAVSVCCVSMLRQNGQTTVSVCGTQNWALQSLHQLLCGSIVGSKQAAFQLRLSLSRFQLHRLNSHKCCLCPLILCLCHDFYACMFAASQFFCLFIMLSASAYQVLTNEKVLQLIKCQPRHHQGHTRSPSLMNL